MYAKSFNGTTTAYSIYWSGSCRENLEILKKSLLLAAGHFLIICVYVISSLILVYHIS